MTSPAKLPVGRKLHSLQVSTRMNESVCVSGPVQILGSGSPVQTKDGTSLKEVKIRLLAHPDTLSHDKVTVMENKATSSFLKIKLHKSLVLSILLYDVRVCYFVCRPIALDSLCISTGNDVTSYTSGRPLIA